MDTSCQICCYHMEGMMKMVDIDYIMDLLDWNRSEEEQAEGLRLARQVKAFNVFLQPCDKKNSKNVWDNCALILSEKEDSDLYPYLFELFMWIRDLNWPGAFCIVERLKEYGKRNASFSRDWQEAYTCAQALEDEVWIENLKMVQHT